MAIGAFGFAEGKGAGGVGFIAGDLVHFQREAGAVFVEGFEVTRNVFWKMQPVRFRYHCFR